MRPGGAFCGTLARQMQEHDDGGEKKGFLPRIVRDTRNVGPSLIVSLTEHSDGGGLWIADTAGTVLRLGVAYKTFQCPTFFERRRRFTRRSHGRSPVELF